MTATHCNSRRSQDANRWSETTVLPDALSVLETEVERVSMERDAFETFAETVATVDPTPSTTATPLESDGSHEALATVRTAYRESVMAVPHYAEEYGECLRENMAVELQRDAATAVVDGDQWSPQLQQLVIYRARVAARQRESLLETLDREQSSIETARDRLRDNPVPDGGRPIPQLDQQSRSSLVDRAVDLQTRIERCEGVLTDRQRQIHRANGQYDEAELYFQSYLYASLDTTVPVLDVALDRIRQLQDRRDVVIEAIVGVG